MSAPANGTVAAIDLGATSGRVMLAHVGPNTLEIAEVARFPNIPVSLWEGDRAALHWNVVDLYRNVIEGLGTAFRMTELSSIGFDSWGVDYGLLQAGRLIGSPYHYRDDRTSCGVALTAPLIEPAELYQQNGLQFLPFNSLYQLATDQVEGVLRDADTLLLIPDLLTYWTTGQRIAELTNATTTGLVSQSGRWNYGLVDRLGLPRRIFPELVQPGNEIGGLLPTIVGGLRGNSSRTKVMTVGSHDTASAVVAVPMRAESAAYISCGTWGLVGVELDRPVLTEAARSANFTNEGGIDGRVCFQRNVMGMWLLSESIRCWRAQGHDVDLVSLLDQAADLRVPVAVFDANDPRFLAPGNLPARIADWCTERELAAPRNPVEFVRSIVESLAEAFAISVHKAGELTGRNIDIVHVVGGGARNSMLCQLVADRTGKLVLAGPTEATAIGNGLVQARAVGLISGDLDSLRALVGSSHKFAHFVPRDLTLKHATRV